MLEGESLAPGQADALAFGDLAPESPSDADMAGFYDELAPFYHLIFPDWEASVRWQGRSLTDIIRSHWPNHRTVLDVSCGIGTQSIALAANDFEVTGSDLSVGAIERATMEANSRKLGIAFSVCDMRQAFAHHGARQFDVVISCDNSVPHLLTQTDISSAFDQMFACLQPGGGCLITVRDYEQEPRGTNIFKPVRVSTNERQRVIVFQIWDFDGDHYELTMFLIVEDLASGNLVTRSMRSRYYAVGISELLSMMRDAGFESVKRLDEVFYQPVLIGTKPR